jgi:hypothetical protein
MLIAAAIVTLMLLLLLLLPSLVLLLLLMLLVLHYAATSNRGKDIIHCLHNVKGSANYLIVLQAVKHCYMLHPQWLHAHIVPPRQRKGVGS